MIGGSGRGGEGSADGDDNGSGGPCYDGACSGDSGSCCGSGAMMTLLVEIVVGVDGGALVIVKVEVVILVEVALVLVTVMAL